MTKKQSATIWLCENCGNEFSVWAGKCPMCGEWNTFKELKFDSTKSIKSIGKKIAVEHLSEIVISKTDRIMTGISEFDRVLGGGVVPGSIILIGGEPGIGKSTLILEVADKIGNTFYISAEESGGQVKMRSDRLGIASSTLNFASESDIDAIIHEAQKSKPNLLIVDSIQTVYTSDYDSTPGSLVQVRECGMKLQQFAKSSGIPVIIIGHVTKEGNLAGPRVLEHLVDTVLYLEGERFNDARILRGVKNRFGPTNEVGIFSMQEKGMLEISNPSELFLTERKSSPGSVVTVTLEGTRPILIEVQALVVPTHFGYPKRTSSGFDLNRLNLLAAVICKNAGINLGNSDIYLNVVGGLKISEPAADLAVCAAIISSYKNRVIDPRICLFGEVGLLGEIRQVTRKKDREKEAKALGYNVLSGIKEIKELVCLV